MLAALPFCINYHCALLHNIFLQYGKISLIIVQYYTGMTEYERKKIDMELKVFASKHLEKPADCRNIDQIRLYVGELASKIRDLEVACNYAPDWAYAMLAQYNAKQNTFLFAEFRNSYR